MADGDVDEIQQIGLGDEVTICNLSYMKTEMKTAFVETIKAKIQWHQEYFNANETAMNYALMIVFFRLLDFCIF